MSEVIILDTDHVSMVQRGEGDEFDRLSERLDLASRTSMICVTIISFEEQLRGWLAYVAKARKPKEIINAYNRLHAFEVDYRSRTILPFDDVAFEIYRELVRGRLGVGAMDLKIASIALAHRATLASRNLRDFEKVPRLKVEDWST